MPRAKKIVARKKIELGVTKLNKALQAAVKRAEKVTRRDDGELVMDERKPKDMRRLTQAMSLFVNAVCRDILEYPEEVRRSWRDQPLNLNTVFDELVALKTARDSWRTRCESIEAAFNSFAPAAIPEKVSAPQASGEVGK
jgi:hypothetical protein